MRVQKYRKKIGYSNDWLSFVALVFTLKHSKMLIFKEKEALKAHINKLKAEGHSVGFVPTMGALHLGHLSLIEKSRQENDVVVCSIFVNPTQFNSQNDFSNYPRTEESDLEMLKSAGCDIVYLPTFEDIYDNEQPFEIDLGGLDQVMEGPYRPGHFKGVVRVVKRFFEIVEPHKSYFGLKDYQQFLILKTLAKKLNIGGEIIGCETLREASGLAMSSRNMLLSDEEKLVAIEIFRAFKAIEQCATTSNLQECIELEKSRLSQWFDIDYLDARSGENLQLITETPNPHIRLFFAGRLGKVRLIDNIKL
jgi:pantoate--beta-alanine ligase